MFTLFPMLAAGAFIVYAAYSAFMLGYTGGEYAKTDLNDTFGLIAYLAMVLFFPMTLVLLLIGGVARGMRSES